MMTFQRRAPATKVNEKQDRREEQEPIVELPGSRFADHAKATVKEEMKRSELSDPNVVKMRMQTQKHFKDPMA